MSCPNNGPTNPTNEGGVPSVMGVQRVSEAERLAYADRDKYVADTDFIPRPGQGVSTMRDKAYLKQRAALIQPNGKSLGRAVCPPSCVSTATASPSWI